MNYIKNLLVIAPLVDKDIGAGGLVNFHLVSALSHFFNIFVLSCDKNNKEKRQLYDDSFKIIYTSIGFLHFVTYFISRIITYILRFMSKTNTHFSIKHDDTDFFNNHYYNLFKIKKRFLIPDTFIDWFPIGVYSGFKCIKKEKISAVLSSAPPYTSHLIAYTLSKLFNLPLILFYQDPWVIEKSVKRGKFRYKFEFYIENKIVHRADLIIFCTEATRNEYLKLFQLDIQKTAVVYYGFDPNDFDYSLSPDKGTVVNLIYGGRIVPGQRDISPFLNALAKLPKHFPLHVDLFIKEGYLYYRQQISKLNIENLVSVHPPLDHKEFCYKLRQYDYVILFGNTDPLQIPSKLFEYIGSRRPIFLIKNNPNMDETSKIVESMENSIICNNKCDEIESALYKMIELKNRNEIFETSLDYVTQFTWYNREKIYVDLIKRVLNNSEK